MSRWHTTDCTRPEIRIEYEQKLPRCHACSASPQEVIQTFNQTPPVSFSPPPSDEPPGRLGLRWPSPLYFTDVTKERLSDKHECKVGGKGGTPIRSDDDDRKQNDAIEPTPPTLSPIYGNRELRFDEFRLICISGADDTSKPIHITLEVYQRRNCPEYETVSYTWGGEDGDNTLCRPIFIGHFWDVAFQTKNCWDMLHWLRPTRGIKFVWIDAVCINQLDIGERAQQVAQMSLTYSECSQVVLWLGSDMVSQNQNHYPSRHRLPELVNSGTSPTREWLAELPNLEKLLQRRYFRRIWVIQEIVLAPRVLIPLKDHVFWADASIAQSLLHALDWRSTQAPWFSRLAQSTIEATSILELLALTAGCEAGDPRDRLFGILGLQASTLYADYSLSTQHFFIGVFSHFIIHERHWGMLNNARGTSAGHSSLTWVPDWNSQIPWNRILQSSAPNEDNILHKIISDIPQKPGGILLNITRHQDTYVSICRPWHKNAYVDGATGSLSIYLTRLCTIRSRPMEYRNTGCPLGYDRYTGKLRVYSIDERGTTQKSLSIYLISSWKLDSVVQTGDEIFLFDPGVPAELQYLILRRMDQGQSHMGFVAYCNYLMIQSDFGQLRQQYDYIKRHHGPKIIKPSGKWIHDITEAHLPGTIPLEIIQLSIRADLRGLHVKVDRDHVKLARLLQLYNLQGLAVQDKYSRALFISGHKRDELRLMRPFISLLICCVKNNRITGKTSSGTIVKNNSEATLRQRYLEIALPLHQLYFSHDYVCITVNHHKVLLMIKDGSFLRTWAGWEWTREDKEDWAYVENFGRFSDRFKRLLANKSRNYIFRYPWNEIRERLEDFINELGFPELYESGVLGKTDDEIMDRLGRGYYGNDFDTNDCYVGSVCKYGILKDYGINGGTFRVSII